MTTSDKKSPRILIIRLSALGDILHALPVLGALRAHYGAGAYIGWMVESAGASVLQGHPMLNALHVFPKKEWKQDKWKTLQGPLRQLRDEVRAQHYDIAIDVQGLTKSAVWGWLSGASQRLGFASPDARELAPWLATQRVKPPREALHVIERNLALLEPLGVRKQDGFVATPAHLPQAARKKAESIIPSSAAPLVMMALGAGWQTKIWEPARFAELAKRLVENQGARVVLAWGPGEEQLVQDAFSALQYPSPDFNTASVPPESGIHVLSRLSFVELGAAIAHARLFVGGDTGPTHFAAALNVPTVSMMGPLDARRNGPYGAHCITIQHAIPRHAPWWENHRRWCDPVTDLKHVTVDEIYAACMSLLQPPAQ